ncbi:MAG: hypothetical protein QOF34_277 [Sphingomonadales bacterium]|nr:hypothetical protein [Sphingomonadales bacterium]
MTEGVWTHGGDTGFEAWVGERSRKVIVTREAIEDHLRLDPVAAAAMSAEDRRRFVIDNLAIVIAAANRKTDPADQAETVMIRAGEIQGPPQ